MSKPELTAEERDALDRALSTKAIERVTWEAARNIVADAGANFFREGKDDLAREFRAMARVLDEKRQTASEQQHEILKKLGH